MSPADSIIDVGDKHVLRVQYGRRMGKLYVDARFWLLDQATNRLAPTRRGIQAPAGHLHEIIEALNKVQNQMVRDGAFEFSAEGHPPKFCADTYAHDF